MKVNGDGDTTCLRVCGTSYSNAYGNSYSSPTRTNVCCDANTVGFRLRATPERQCRRDPSRPFVDFLRAPFSLYTFVHIFFLSFMVQQTRFAKTNSEMDYTMALTGSAMNPAKTSAMLASDPNCSCNSSAKGCLPKPVWNCATKS